jgi:acetyl-CoA acyltransferase
MTGLYLLALVVLGALVLRMTTLLHEMERRQVRYALQAICCAGGLGTATIIERLG